MKFSDLSRQRIFSVDLPWVLCLTIHAEIFAHSSSYHELKSFASLSEPSCRCRLPHSLTKSFCTSANFYRSPSGVHYLVSRERCTELRVITHCGREMSSATLKGTSFSQRFQVSHLSERQSGLRLASVMHLGFSTINSTFLAVIILCKDRILLVMSKMIYIHSIWVCQSQ